MNTIRKYLGQKKAQRLGVRYRVVHNMGFKDLSEKMSLDGYTAMYFGKNTIHRTSLTGRDSYNNNMNFHHIIDSDNKKILSMSSACGELVGDFEEKFKAAETYFHGDPNDRTSHSPSSTTFDPSKFKHFAIEAHGGLIPLTLSSSPGIWPFHFNEGRWEGSRIMGDYCVWFRDGNEAAMATLLLNI